MFSIYIMFYLLSLSHYIDFQPTTRHKSHHKYKRKRKKTTLKSKNLSTALKNQEENFTWETDDDLDSNSGFENNDISGESFLQN